MFPSSPKSPQKCMLAVSPSPAGGQPFSVWLDLAVREVSHKQSRTTCGLCSWIPSLGVSSRPAALGPFPARGALSQPSEPPRVDTARRAVLSAAGGPRGRLHFGVVLNNGAVSVCGQILLPCDLRNTLFLSLLRFVQSFEAFYAGYVGGCRELEPASRCPLLAQCRPPTLSLSPE